MSWRLLRRGEVICEDDECMTDAGVNSTNAAAWIPLSDSPPRSDICKEYHGAAVPVRRKSGESWRLVKRLRAAIAAESSPDDLRAEWAEGNLSGLAKRVVDLERGNGRLRRVVRSVVYNDGGTMADDGPALKRPRWWAIMNMTGLGFSLANSLCAEFGADPDDVIKTWPRRVRGSLVSAKMNSPCGKRIVGRSTCSGGTTASRTEVVRRSMALYDAMLRAQLEGTKIVLRDASGAEESVVLI